MSTSQTPAEPSRNDAPSPGTSLGRYVVIEELGAGGMGRVLRAYDPRLQREVAVKELLADGLDEEGSQRLEAEARAMAKLSHPNVVAVYDVEQLPGGRLVVVMEYVPGASMSAWLRESASRPWQAIVDRFVKAGQGLCAAHRAGLLHRDFKPANVLVDDEAGVVKVTDFGLAKATTEPSSEQSFGRSQISGDDMTAAGTVLGTPRYMSPEQHQGHKLTSATDQYALCVSLWTALCGKAPFTGSAMVERKLAGPPSWPASHVPRRIVDAIRRGLSPEPEQRWPSVEALLTALRYDPARRRRQVLTIAGATSLIAMGAAVVDTREPETSRCTGAAAALGDAWDEGRRDGVRMAVLGVDAGFASDVWARTERELDAYAERWTTMHTDACRASERGEQSADALDLRMACLDRARRQMVAVVDQFADVDADVLERAHLLRGALDPLDRCADLDALGQDVEPPRPDERDAVETIRGLLAEAAAAHAAGRYAISKAKVDEAILVLEPLEYGPIRTEVRLREGLALERLGEFERAEASLRAALELATRWRQWDHVHASASGLMDVVGYDLQRFDEALRYVELARGAAHDDPLQRAKTQSDIAAILDRQGKFEEALEAHREALWLGLEARGPDHPDIATHKAGIAGILHALGKHEEAEAMRREVLAHEERVFGETHPNTITARMNLATVLDSQGRYADAEAELKRALEAWVTALGPDHPDVALSRVNLALSLENQGKHDEALEQQGLALKAFETAFGPEHPKVLTLRTNMAIVLRGKGETEAAERIQREVLEIRIRVLGEDHVAVAESRSNLGTALLDLERFTDAEEEFRAALPLMEASRGKDHPWVAVGHNNISLALKGQGDLAGVAVEQRLALDTVMRAVPEDHPYVAIFRMNLADLLLEKGNAAEALALAQQAWDRYQTPDIDPADRAQFAWIYGRALVEGGTTAEQREQGVAVVKEALPVLDENPALASQAEQARAWMRIRG